MKRIDYKDIPLHSGGEDGVDTLKSDQPLVIAWKERNGAVERVVRVRSVDFYDVHGGLERLPFDEILDLEDERDRSMRRQVRWFVARASATFKQAEQELYWIVNLYQNAVTMWQSRYNKQKEKLLAAGYSAEVIATVPEPPAEVQLLHLAANGCGAGEIWQGKLGESTSFTLYCKQCGWVRKQGLSKEVVTPDMLHDHQPVTMPSDPDFEEFRFGTDFPDEAYEDGNNEELRQAARENQERTRRCMKAAGVLITVSEAASLLDSTTQNISNYIAKHRIGAWPDPDDTRYRLVLRREVEELA